MTTAFASFARSALGARVQSAVDPRAFGSGFTPAGPFWAFNTIGADTVYNYNPATDTGQTWGAGDDGLPSPLTIIDITIAPSGAAWLLVQGAASAAVVYEHDDDAGTWSSLGSTGLSDPSALETHAGLVYLAHGAGIHTSTTGSGWSDTGSTITNASVLVSRAGVLWLRAGALWFRYVGAGAVDTYTDHEWEYSFWNDVPDASVAITSSALANYPYGGTGSRILSYTTGAARRTGSVMLLESVSTGLLAIAQPGGAIAGAEETHTFQGNPPGAVLLSTSADTSNSAQQLVPPPNWSSVTDTALSDTEMREPVSIRNRHWFEGVVAGEPGNLSVAPGQKLGNIVLGGTPTVGVGTFINVTDMAASGSLLYMTGEVYHQEVRQIAGRQALLATIDSVDATPSDNDFTITIGAASVTVTGTTSTGATNLALALAAAASTDPEFTRFTWDRPDFFEQLRATYTADGGADPPSITLNVSGPGSATVTDFALAYTTWELDDAAGGTTSVSWQGTIASTLAALATAADSAFTEATWSGAGGNLTGTGVIFGDVLPTFRIDYSGLVSLSTSLTVVQAAQVTGLHQFNPATTTWTTLDPAAPANLQRLTVAPA